MEYFILAPADIAELVLIESDNKLIPAALINGNYAVSIDFITEEGFSAFHSFLNNLEKSVLTEEDFV